MSKVIPLNLVHKHKNSQIKKYQQAIVSSGILIVDSKVLLLKRGPNNYPAPNSWTLPAGHVELLEPPEKAVVREFKEETCLDVAVNKLVKVENYFYDLNQIRTHLVEFIYYVVPLNKGLKVKLDNEHVKYNFIPIEELNRYASLAAPRKRAIKSIYKTI